MPSSTGAGLALVGAIGMGLAAARLRRELAVPDLPAAPPGAWANWSGGQQCRPAILRPAHERELAAAVRTGTGTIRPVGAGHSFTPLATSNDLLVSLDRLAGIGEVDRERRRAWVRAGTRLRDLSPALAEHGLALPNLGDIDVQTIAGAVSTATHGTGARLPCLSAQVTGVRLLTADGSVRTATLDDDPDLVHAAQVSLGALGILLDVQLQLRDRFRLERHEWVAATDDVLATAHERWATHRHFEFFALPFAGRSLCLTHDVTDAPATPPVDADDDATLMQLRLAGRLTRRLPRVRRGVLATATSAIPDQRSVGESWRVLPSERRVAFEEMEYHLPVDTGLAAFAEVLAWIEANRPDAWFPIEVRQTAGDEAWLSPFRGGPRISVAVHTAADEDHGWFAEGVEPILRRHGGRPHWGKRHTLDHDDVRSLYPDLPGFLDLRRDLDPNGRFLNAHLRHLLGEA